MPVAMNDPLLVTLVTVACLCLVLMGRGKGRVTKLLLGGAGIAAAMVALALLADRM